MAYPFAALAGGLLAEKLTKPTKAVAFGLGAVACDAIILVSGALWFLALSHCAFSTVFMLAVLPFLPGEVLKAMAAVVVALGKDEVRRRR
jgi:biotin transport system substrate-specific component